ncbi:MAG: CoA-binding protein, partial [Thermodesulfobacteriota bacterium]|nr:CoA-binding protein [Thermodesulfobacteriota bacterium]
MADKNQIEVFLNPKSVAVVGATERPGAWGSMIMQGLLSRNFPGILYPINHKAESIFGLKSYTSIDEVPGTIDLVVIAIPSESVYETIQACTKKSVKGITIITAGFGEAAEEGKGQEAEFATLARSHGIRIVGPNVSGTYNLFSQFNASASADNRLFPTPLTFICQGGFAIYNLLVRAATEYMSAGQFIHTGNECDLQVTDFLEYFGEDPKTEVILMYVEGIRDGQRFLDVSSQVAKKKPLIIFKAGETPSGSRAAASHTGAIAGTNQVYSALFTQLNIIKAPCMEILIPLGHAFLEFPPMKGNRVAIATLGGSWGVALTDTLERNGLSVLQFSEKLQREIRALGIPTRASTKNPIDLGAAGASSRTIDTILSIGRAVLQSGEVDALVVHGYGSPGLLSDDSPPGFKLRIEEEKEIM